MLRNRVSPPNLARLARRAPAVAAGALLPAAAYAHMTSAAAEGLAGGLLHPLSSASHALLVLAGGAVTWLAATRIPARPGAAQLALACLAGLVAQWAILGIVQGHAHGAEHAMAAAGAYAAGLAMATAALHAAGIGLAALVSCLLGAPRARQPADRTAARRP
jgi:urease accessory protein